jgi:2-polyprenyl-3-methyl-5-hydroxy-6-metoxy-1,4-benzoquinol methylase
MEYFTEILKIIYKKSPLQKKKIEKYLSQKNEIFFIEFEEFAASYIGYLNHEKISLGTAVDAYLKLCSNMLICQKKFLKTGKYPVELADEALDNVYLNEITMKSYMIGLAISQFLWSTHYEMYTFFGDHITRNPKNIRAYLEIGPGHGLFLKKAIETLGNDAHITAVDISPISMNITCSTMKYFNLDKQNITYHTTDILDFCSSQKFDFIAMGEVLEHVNNPGQLLRKLGDLLSDHGSIYISTCVNCPAIDHVYHFRTIPEVQHLITSCNYSIHDERILPVENLPMQEIIDRKITINYCAILKKGDM